MRSLIIGLGELGALGELGELGALGALGELGELGALGALGALRALQAPQVPGLPRAPERCFLPRGGLLRSLRSIAPQAMERGGAGCGAMAGRSLLPEEAQAGRTGVPLHNS